jgi:hypothetical protein
MTYNDDWFEDYADDDDESEVSEYDITAAPNDFNVSTLFNFIESGAVKIPGFQRHFVWDIKRSSKLIESLVLGLPVPQIFLYEESRNSFLVIDGQQRLMSIYYFIKQRFPLKEKRAELRLVFEEHGKIPDHILHDDNFFDNFRLQLPVRTPGHFSRLAGLGYSTLGDNKIQFDLRPVRNIIVKQNSPEGDDSSIYEIFSRLNTGGVNLAPQEIRLSLYHSGFYDMLMRVNLRPRWRTLLAQEESDLHMKDVEVLLRCFAMLVDSKHYAPSMVKFLNGFSKKCRTHTKDKNDYLEELFDSFLESTSSLPDDIFINKRNKRFNIALIESVFAASCVDAFESQGLIEGRLDADSIRRLSIDGEFMQAAGSGTTKSVNVLARLRRGRSIVEFE